MLRCYSGTLLSKSHLVVLQQPCAVLLMLQAFILQHAVADGTAKCREKRGSVQVSSHTVDFPLSTLQETEDKKELNLLQGIYLL